MVSEDSVTKDTELLLTKGARGVRDHQDDGAENSHHPIGWSTGPRSFRRISDQHNGRPQAPEVAIDDSVNHVHVEVHFSVDLRQPHVEL